MIDVTELQKRINALGNESPEAPTDGGDEWNLYLKYMNMAYSEWASSYDWPSLYKEVNTMTSTATGNVTVSLPSDFRKLASHVKISDSSTESYPEVDPQVREKYLSTDKYVYILGYPSSYKMIVNPGNHGSGASIYYSYWSTPASLVSPADVSLCPDPAFLVKRSVAYLWESKDDNRAIALKNESDRILSRMLEQEMVRGYGYTNRVYTTEQSNHGFVIGRD